MAPHKHEVEKFTGHNDFNLWKLKMMALLESQGLESALEEPSSTSDKSSTSKLDMDLETINRKARSEIILSLGDEVLREVGAEKSALGLWKRLDELYMTKSLANRLYLKKNLFGLSLVEGGSLNEHIDSFNKAVIDLETVDVKISDEDKAILLLSSLPKSYEHFVDTLLYGRESLTMKDVRAALNSKVLVKKSEQQQQNSAAVLVARGRAESRESKVRNSSRSKSRGKSKKCYFCKKEGHFRRDCPERKAKYQGKRPEADAAIVYEEDYEVAETLVASNGQNTGEWILDSGCTFHMCPNKALFTSYQSINGCKVLMGNNMACQVIGMGNIRLKLHDGSVRELLDVRHVPDLKRNLISLGMLDQSGCTFKGESGTLKVIKGSMVVMRGERKHGLYVLSGEAVIGSASFSVDNENMQTKLWHLRLGHLGERGLKELYDQGVFGKGKIQPMGFCEHCVLGKAHRVKFNTGEHNTKGTLDYIHSDLWGPAQAVTHGGARYFLSFIDDYSRKLWVYVLKSKEQVFETF